MSLVHAISEKDRGSIRIDIRTNTTVSPTKKDDTEAEDDEWSIISAGTGRSKSSSFSSSTLSGAFDPESSVDVDEDYILSDGNDNNNNSSTNPAKKRLVH
jgi:hypothetical protein